VPFVAQTQEGGRLLLAPVAAAKRVRVWAGKRGGGAKGKGTSKEWNKQQAKATQALKAGYFDVYMVKMLESKQAAGASWSKPGVTQQAQVALPQALPPPVALRQQSLMPPRKQPLGSSHLVPCIS
jgi:hypothetical protein